MKHYKIRPGIVHTTICNSELLIPSRSVYDACRTIKRLSLFEYAIWDAFEKNKPFSDIVKIFMLITKKDEDTVTQLIDKYLASLYEKGFLIEVGEENDEGGA